MSVSKHICPKCGGKAFLTTAHVAQTWEVDADGNFVDCVSTEETVAQPDDGNIWTCKFCGAEAVLADTLPKDHTFPAMKPHGDDDFLANASDRIDNASWEAIYTAVTGKTEDVPELILCAMEALAHDPDAVRKVPFQPMAAAIQHIEEQIALSASENSADTTDPEWDMAIIGDVNDAIEYELQKMGVATCYPYQDDDECICYMQEGRCAHCTHGPGKPAA